ncbi:Peptidase, C2 family [Granulibacter bethesdensis]|uniref:Peptidase, C2 family n=1 Tax=Granulibacter bethesdensis TaxID=364410 RepID=A0AAN0VGB0_9PROT|nr:C2 family cysteine protease [Granulibacter bethesdensis]AHJ63428.1 Peptidase, C2 family [Granulibacter bethesdensis]
MSLKKDTGLQGPSGQGWKPFTYSYRYGDSDPLSSQVTYTYPNQALYLTEPGDSTAILYTDIHQGQIGDCYVLSSIGELAMWYPGAIERMITRNADGTESVTLYMSANGTIPHYGETSFVATTVKVTNTFLRSGVNNGSSQNVVNGTKEIWPQVLEKAIATLGGGYSSIAYGGNPTTTLMMLTGQTAQAYYPYMSAEMLQGLLATKSLVVMDTGTSSLSYGLVGSHAYMLTGLSYINGEAYVNLANPWGYNNPAPIPVSQLANAGIVEIDVGHYVPAAITNILSISGTAGNQAVNDNASLNPFANVQIADTGINETETVTITQSALNGRLTSLGSGSYDAATGVYKVTGSVDSVNAALRNLVFIPNAHQVTPGSTVTTGFRIDVTDQDGVSASDSITSVITTAVNNAPIITGLSSSSLKILDVGYVSPFAGTVISEPDFGQTETAVVTLSNASNGSLSNLSGGTYDAAKGIYQVTGTADQVSQALKGLVFNPTPHHAAANTQETTGLTLTVTDSGGASTSATTSVVVTETAANKPFNDSVNIRAFSTQVISQPIDAASNGTFKLNILSTAEFASTVSGAIKIDFKGFASQLVIDNASTFGNNVGTASYTGPLLKDFGRMEFIDIHGLSARNLKSDYSASTGLLQLTAQNGAKATLDFDPGSLGGRNFAFFSDGHGGTLITRF